MKKNPAAVALGKVKTAKKSRAARQNAAVARRALASIDPEQRAAIARKGALAMHKKHGHKVKATS
jgi:hypothetical protein